MANGEQKIDDIIDFADNLLSAWRFLINNRAAESKLINSQRNGGSQNSICFCSGAKVGCYMPSYLLIPDFEIGSDVRIMEHALVRMCAYIKALTDDKLTKARRLNQQCVRVMAKAMVILHRISRSINANKIMEEFLESTLETTLLNKKHKFFNFLMEIYRKLGAETPLRSMVAKILLHYTQRCMNDLKMKIAQSVGVACEYEPDVTNCNTMLMVLLMIHEAGAPIPQLRSEFENLLSLMVSMGDRFLLPYLAYKPYFEE